MVNLKKSLKVVLMTAGIQLSMVSAALAGPALSLDTTTVEATNPQECEQIARSILREEGLHTPTNRTGEGFGSGSGLGRAGGGNETYMVIIDCYRTNGTVEALVAVAGDTSLSETNALKRTLVTRLNRIR